MRARPDVVLTAGVKRQPARLHRFTGGVGIGLGEFLIARHRRERADAAEHLEQTLVVWNVGVPRTTALIAGDRATAMPAHPAPINIGFAAHKRTMCSDSHRSDS